MAIHYQELQEGGALAFRTSADQRKRAAQIMNSLAEILVEELGFPRENVVFAGKEKSEEENSGRMFADQVIDRDEKGRWNACMKVRVDTDQPGGGGHLITHLFLEVHFASDEVQLELVEDGGGVVSLSYLPGASQAQFASFVDRITSIISETNDWLRTGIGKQRVIGFGATGV
jgi:hypothetical protein